MKILNVANIGIKTPKPCQSIEEWKARVTSKFVPGIICPSLINDVEAYARGEAQDMHVAGVISDFEGVRAWITSDQELQIAIIPKKQELKCPTCKKEWKESFVRFHVLPFTIEEKCYQCAFPVEMVTCKECGIVGHVRQSRKPHTCCACLEYLSHKLAFERRSPHRINSRHD